MLKVVFRNNFQHFDFNYNVTFHSSCGSQLSLGELLKFFLFVCFFAIIAAVYYFQKEFRCHLGSLRICF